jgi:Sulfate permease family/Protein of unknown function (DUF1214)
VKLPLFVSLRGYRSSWLRADLIAGLTVWAVLVPESLAYATIAGVSPVIGLYAAPAALILYAAFGSSRHLIAGPMAATAALSAAAVAELTTRGSNDFVGLTVALALTTGIMAAAAGLLRLGFLASFISEPVLKGFIVGLALTIMVGQLPKIFGTEGVDGIDNDQQRGDRGSRDADLRFNDDGSVDVYFGPSAPEGKESNWVQTIPGKHWFSYFRFYGPLGGYFDRTWKWGDFYSRTAEKGSSRKPVFSGVA